MNPNQNSTPTPRNQSQWRENEAKPKPETKLCDKPIFNYRQIEEGKRGPLEDEK